MTDDAPLATLLRTSTVSADAPPVDRLRRVIAARRRRRRRAAAAAVVVPALALALVGSMARWSGGDPERVEAVDRAGITAPTTTASAPATTASAPATTASAPPPTAMASTTTAEAAVRSGPPILVPTGDWELRGLSSTGVMPTNDLVTLITDAGDLGPMAVVRFNAGVDTLDYADGPPTHRDTTSPGGRTVRVGHGDDLDRRTVIFLVEGGSVAITSEDVEEPVVLELSDAVEVVDGRAVLRDDEALPGDFRVDEPGFEGPSLTTSYSLERGTETVSIRVNRRRGDVQDLWDVRYRPEIVESTIGGHRTLLSPGDNGPLGETLALILTEDWVYTVGLPPWAADSPPATLEEIETVVASLEAIDEDELSARLPGLQNRRDLLGRWFADAGPTATAGIGWMLDGPPMGVGESHYYHQVLTCAVVRHWLETGDPDGLDRLGDHAAWAVSADLEASWRAIDAANPNGDAQAEARLAEAIVDGVVVAEARAATTEAERRSTDLAQDSECGWFAELSG